MIDLKDPSNSQVAEVNQIRKQGQKSMSKVVSIELVWNYTPENYFTKPVSIPIEGGKIEIAKGQALATIDSSIFNSNNGLMDALDDFVESQFCAVQHMTHQTYELSMPLKLEIRDDGSETPCLI
jgi:hypothetical protein